MDELEIHTTEMHAGGEPVRIIERGFPAIEGATLLDKRRFVREHHDDLRTALMFEPRGHDDMYGALLVEPDHPDADLAVLFMHNEGYSTMCGHATLALGRYAIERRLVEAVSPETHLVLQCPCGPVDVYVDVDEAGKVSGTRFHSVDAFAAALDLEIEVPGYGTIVCDIGYGGAFYAFARASAFGLEVRGSPVAELVAAAAALTDTLRTHPAIGGTSDPDLHFLYGSILTDGLPGMPSAASANICVFADAQVDRSPTGSGVTARIALATARGEVEPGEVRHFRSVIGTEMTGTVVAIQDHGDTTTVTVEVGGKAHFTGRSIFTWERNDPLAKGFRVR